MGDAMPEARLGELPIEPMITYVVQWVRLGIETIGALIVCIGALVALWNFGRAMLSNSTGGFNRLRQILARYLVLALEFQLAADILSTAIAPSWSQIGKLGAIAVIRTLLNYFLIREMRQDIAGIEATEPGKNHISAQLSTDATR